MTTMLPKPNKLYNDKPSFFSRFKRKKQQVPIKERKTEIEVEKTVSFVESEKVWAVSLRTLKPYGKHYPRTLYTGGCFDKDLQKALEKAWKELQDSVDYYDAQDKQLDNMETKIVKALV